MGIYDDGTSNENGEPERLMNANGWQPIETAPENARILVAHWFHNSHMGIEIKQKARGEFIYPSRYYRPVAWMHLPDLPADATAGRG